MIAIVACGSDKVKNIEEVLATLGAASKTIALADADTTNFNAFSGVIISGSPLLVTDPGMEQHLSKFQFVESYEKPIFGICFGHQVLALLYGAEGILGEAIKGDELVTVITPDLLFSGLGEQAYFSQNHRESVTLPEDFELLATSASCQNEAMRHKTKQLFGVQFHPEVSGDAGVVLFKNFIALCEEETIKPIA